MDGGAVPAPSATPIRWGVSDAVIAWAVSLAVGAIAVAPFFDAKLEGIPPSDEPIALFAGLAFQTLAAVALLEFVARRKGRGSLRLDFGFGFVPRDAPWILGGLLVGGLSSLLLLPIIELGDIEEKSQDVRRIFDEAHGGKLALLILGVLVIAPIGEELLFRGALLRGLRRRMPVGQAVFVSAMAFALVHVVLDLGTAYGVPALLLLGLVSAWRAVETQRLSQSMALHCGFNLLVAVARVL